MYPLHMTSAAGGFALANDEDEHRSLSAHGYEPKLRESQTAETGTANTKASHVEGDAGEQSELQQLRAKAKAAGVKGGHLMGVEKLRAALGL